jgi:hypothetical protein
VPGELLAASGEQFKVGGEVFTPLADPPPDHEQVRRDIEDVLLRSQERFARKMNAREQRILVRLSDGVANPEAAEEFRKAIKPSQRVTEAFRRIHRKVMVARVPTRRSRRSLERVRVLPRRTTSGRSPRGRVHRRIVASRDGPRLGDDDPHELGARLGGFVRVVRRRV